MISGAHSLTLRPPPPRLSASDVGAASSACARTSEVLRPRRLLNHRYHGREAGVGLGVALAGPRAVGLVEELLDAVQAWARQV